VDAKNLSNKVVSVLNSLNISSTLTSSRLSTFYNLRNPLNTLCAAIFILLPPIIISINLLKTKFILFLVSLLRCPNFSVDSCITADKSISIAVPSG
jgi:hypothetical protein